ncbi:hypothetical protein EV421DRAFT_2041418 [Armillaria borealis]|uniref:Glycosyltransferase 61 catalytic domain-containing protein n=1 Tax=Armillaria borealis TaxID=47425 RepID=A0AA39IV74_9AGAR|nr:hypothetical protein EV421DRAFT_2041418 [Armillaria borealis]
MARLTITILVCINVILLSGMIYLNFHSILEHRPALQYRLQPLRGISKPGRPSESKSYTQADFVPMSEEYSLARSTAWVPLSLSECTSGMPAHYALCVAQRLEQDVVYAEELLYSSFRIRQPYFASNAYKERWGNIAMGIKERGVLQTDGWLVYKGQSGQNFVSARISVHSGGYDRWSAESCMSDLVSSDSLKTFHPLELLGRSNPPTIYRNAMLATSPDSYSFQHYLDRITHIVAQGVHLIDGSDLPYVITGRQGDQFVQQLWERLGFDDKHVLHSIDADIYAENMIFSCRAVLVHSFLSLRTLEAFGIDSMKESSTRDKIMYMTRSNDRAKNGGRRVLNETALLDAIRVLFRERGKGEEIVIFDETQYSSASELFDYFNKNVMAVVGPHASSPLGSSGYACHRDDAYDVHVRGDIRRSSGAFSDLCGVGPSSPGGRDIIIDPEDVTKLLREHLGVPMRKPRHMGFLAVEETDQQNGDHLAEDPLRASYQWGGKELGF